MNLPAAGSDLYREIADCPKCELARYRTQTVPGSGPIRRGGANSRLDRQAPVACLLPRRDDAMPTGSWWESEGAGGLVTRDAG